MTDEFPRYPIVPGDVCTVRSPGYAWTSEIAENSDEAGFVECDDFVFVISYSGYARCLALCVGESSSCVGYVYSKRLVILPTTGA